MSWKMVYIYLEFMLHEPRSVPCAVNRSCLKCLRQALVVVVMEVREEEMLDARALRGFGELVYQEFASRD
jgi:hypothetical protein